MEKRNHHYIPQFYLRKFTDPNVPAKYEPYLWVIDLKEKTLKKKAPNNICYIKGFNDIKDENGDLSTIIEDEFGKIENISARILRKILEFKYISRSERLKFCKFIYSMRARVPYFRDLSTEILNNEVYRKQLETSLKRTDLPNSIDMDAVIRTTHTHLVSHMLLKMNWCLMIASEGSSFVTSDNPVVVTDPYHQDWIFTGFNSPNVQVTFPLSPVVCLLGGWEDRLPLIWNVDATIVKNINSLTLRNSQRYVFSSSREVEALF